MKDEVTVSHNPIELLNLFLNTENRQTTEGKNIFSTTNLSL